MIKILLIEDEDKRVAKIRSWLPDDVHLVHAATTGSVPNILSHAGDAFAGIMLDHDLHAHGASIASSALSGSTVVKIVSERISTDAPILIHSMNIPKGKEMTRYLQSQGFDVTRIPMKFLNEDLFRNWLDEVRECWGDRI